MNNTHNKPTKRELKYRIWKAEQERIDKALSEHLKGLSKEEFAVFENAMNNHFGAKEI